MILYPLNYLFILCAEGLSSLIESADNRGEIFHGCKVCRGALSISHLLLADDSFLFFKASIEESITIKKVLEDYEMISRQAINFNKPSIFFSPNVVASVKESISSTLGVSSPLHVGRYLGLPSLLGKSRRVIFGFLKDRLWKRLQGWKNKFLSRVGKEVLIKSVAQEIPSYCMSTFLLSKSLCD